MGRLIDEQTAYAVLTDYYHHTTETQHAALREALKRVETVDAVPNHDDAAAWDEAFRAANEPLKGLPEYASHIMLFFWEELHARDMERGTT